MVPQYKPKHLRTYPEPCITCEMAVQAEAQDQVCFAAQEAQTRAALIAHLMLGTLPCGQNLPDQ